MNRAAGRYIPRDLDRRLHHLGADSSDRMWARYLARELEGRLPAAVEDAEREALASRCELRRAQLDYLLGFLERAGVGQRPTRRRCERRHGERLEQRLVRVGGKLPRALALRLPTSADTHRHGPIDGEDIYGRVTSSHTLRAAHQGTLAALLGLAGQPGRRDEAGYVYSTGGELAFLLQGRRRRSGADLAWVFGLLGDLAQLELEAVVRPNRRGEAPSGAHRIPCSPVAAVERRVAGHWVSIEDYAQLASGQNDDDDRPAEHDPDVAVGEGPQHATVRVRFAPWVWTALEDEQRPPVFVDLAVWSHLGPLAQRLYVLVQSLGRSSYDDRLYFYLSPRLLLTLGLKGTRLHEAATMVRHALSTLQKADLRIQGFGESPHANTRYPAFSVKAERGKASRPSTFAQAYRAAPRRPRLLRAVSRRRSHPRIPWPRRSELDAQSVRRLGVQGAQRELYRLRAMLAAGAPGQVPEIGSQGPSHSARAGPAP